LPAEAKAIKLPLGRAHAAPPGHDRNQTMSNPDRPFGWRKRIGLLSPTVIETAAYDFYRLAPDGVSMCATTSNIEQSASKGAGERTSLHEPCKFLQCNAARGGRRWQGEPAHDLPRTRIFNPMNLAEFVEETLSEILSGIRAAQKKDGGEAAGE